MLSCHFRGIVPITCDELFKTMQQNKDANKVSIMLNLLVQKLESSWKKWVGGAVRFFVVGTIGQEERPPQTTTG